MVFELPELQINKENGASAESSDSSKNIIRHSQKQALSFVTILLEQLDDNFLLFREKWVIPSTDLS